MGISPCAEEQLRFQKLFKRSSNFIQLQPMVEATVNSSFLPVAVAAVAAAQGVGSVGLGAGALDARAQDRWSSGQH